MFTIHQHTREEAMAQHLCSWMSYVLLEQLSIWLRSNSNYVYSATFPKSHGLSISQIGIYMVVLILGIIRHAKWPSSQGSDQHFGQSTSILLLKVWI